MNNVLPSKEKTRYNRMWNEYGFLFRNPREVKHGKKKKIMLNTQALVCGALNRYSLTYLKIPSIDSLIP